MLLPFLPNGLGSVGDIFQELFVTVLSLWAIVGTTPLAYTTQNTIVTQMWQTMVLVADSLLGVFTVIGTVQIMYADVEGQLSMPMGQFLGKVVLTALLIHLSAFLGESLLTLNNLFCELVAANVQTFLTQTRHFTQGNLVTLQIMFLILFFIGLIRVIFQAIKRIVRFNLLFVLSGPAFLTSLLPGTSVVFTIWARMFVITIFEQFFQALTLGMGTQFLALIAHTGLLGLIFATAMLYMTAEIPSLLTRFGAAASGTGGGLVGTAIKVAMLFR